MEGNGQVVRDDFRDDPTLMKMLRAAIGGVAMGLPSFEDGVQQRMLVKYRETTGERGTSAMYSAAALQLDKHAKALRQTFAAVLGSCLYSQLDRIQGREAAWPMPDGDGPGLVPDSVINRRMVIDNLTRRIDLDADEGFTRFDMLLGTALGREAFGLRNNPLRPAVFFHAVGLCWTRAGGLQEHALIESFGEQLLPRVINVYPAMCAVLRTGLGIERVVPTPLPMQARTGADGESLYTRLAQQQRPAAGGSNGGAVTPAPDQASSAAPPAARDSTAGPPSVAGPAAGATSGSAAAAADQAWPLERVSRLFEPVFVDETLPVDVRLSIARLQMPALMIAREEPGCLTDAAHPFRVLLAELADAGRWQQGAASGHGDAMRLQLGVIVGLLNHPTPLPINARHDVLEHLIEQFRSLRGDAGKVIDLAQRRQGVRSVPG
ncbi:MAG TPA: DUF1631 family protein [Burkholderiaceae bacterium]|nr:DUF1631 family protein [Burkholderiaceae bacterium]